MLKQHTGTAFSQPVVIHYLFFKKCIKFFEYFNILKRKRLGNLIYKILKMPLFFERLICDYHGREYTCSDYGPLTKNEHKENDFLLYFAFTRLVVLTVAFPR